MKRIVFLDPRGTPAVPPEPYDLFLASAVDRPVFGLLANGFVDSVAFGARLGAALQAILPHARTVQLAKPEVSAVAGSPLLDQLAAECGAVIGLYGHCGSCTNGTVRDVIEIARRGRPSVALITEKFAEQGTFIADAAGMPDIPRILLPHPTAGRGVAFLEQLAEEIAPKVLVALRRPAATA